MNRKPGLGLDRSHAVGVVNSSFHVEEPLNMSHGSNMNTQENGTLSVYQQQISDGFFSQFTSTEEVYKYLVQVGT